MKARKRKRQFPGVHPTHTHTPHNASLPREQSYGGRPGGKQEEGWAEDTAGQTGPPSPPFFLPSFPSVLFSRGCRLRPSFLGSLLPTLPLGGRASFPRLSTIPPIPPLLSGHRSPLPFSPLHPPIHSRRAPARPISPERAGTICTPFLREPRPGTCFLCPLPRDGSSVSCIQPTTARSPHTHTHTHATCSLRRYSLG